MKRKFLCILIGHKEYDEYREVMELPLDITKKEEETLIKRLKSNLLNIEKLKEFEKQRKEEFKKVDRMIMDEFCLYYKTTNHSKDFVLSETKDTQIQNNIEEILKSILSDFCNQVTKYKFNGVRKDFGIRYISNLSFLKNNDEELKKFFKERKDELTKSFNEYYLFKEKLLLEQKNFDEINFIFDFLKEKNTYFNYETKFVVEEKEIIPLTEYSKLNLK